LYKVEINKIGKNVKKFEKKPDGKTPTVRWAFVRQLPGFAAVPIEPVSPRQSIKVIKHQKMLRTLFYRLVVKSFHIETV
jgi:hypothetical protein